MQIVMSSPDSPELPVALNESKTHVLRAQVGIMQIVDSLSPGGMERVAVNIANNLHRDHFTSHLCTTRSEGPLMDSIGPSVSRLHLARRGRFDIQGVKKLVEYVRRHNIRILHAHSTSLFVAVVAARFSPYPAVIWHDHFGGSDIDDRSAWIYGFAARRLAGIIAVNENLANWSRVRLKFSSEKVWYVPNFVAVQDMKPVDGLPGAKGSRIVCVANLRPQKDHANLLEAMKLVVARVPEAHLILLGSPNDNECVEYVQRESSNGVLAGHVTWLGSRKDVPGILRACDLGVLSSISEGLPLSLIEYGMAGLPAVSTRVGQCEEVLDGGRVGMLVPSGSPQELAAAITSMLESPERRTMFAGAFLDWVKRRYSMEQGMKRICGIYETVLEQGARIGVQK